MAELPKACPVILLAVQASILLVVLVGQGGPALAAPAAGDEDPLVTLSPSSPRGAASAQPPHGSLGKLLPLFPTLLQGHRIHVAPSLGWQRVAPGVPAQAGSVGTGRDTRVDRARDTGQGQTWGGRCQSCMDTPASSRTHRGMCQAHHRHASLVTDSQRDMPRRSQTQGHASLVTDRRTCHPGHGCASLVTDTWKDVPPRSQTKGRANLVTDARRDVPPWSQTCQLWGCNALGAANRVQGDAPAVWGAGSCSGTVRWGVQGDGGVQGGAARGCTGLCNRRVRPGVQRGL